MDKLNVIMPPSCLAVTSTLLKYTKSLRTQAPSNITQEVFKDHRQIKFS